MFLTDVLVKAGKKILKDVETLGKNTNKVGSALLSGDKESLEQLSDEFLENAAVGCVAIAAKKAGLGVITAIVNGDDIADSVGDALGHVNPVVMTIVGANALMAGICKVAADDKFRADITSGLERIANAAIKKV